MHSLISGTVIENKHWHDALFSLRITTEPFPFRAGQYVRVGLANSENKTQRAYSMVNGPNSEYLEFVITRVENGALSPYLAQLKPGDLVTISQPASGFFMLDDIPDGKSLWLIATGTGIGPYLSMLSTEQPWERFQKIYLIHGVRHKADLTYSDLIGQWQQRAPQQFTYQPVITREKVAGALHDRIPALIKNGELEQATGGTLDTSAQIMLCGNPEMITGARSELAEKGLAIHLRRRPGNVTIEQYWK